MQQMLDAESSAAKISNTFMAEKVASVIKMVRGKSPGHDGLSVEYLRYQYSFARGPRSIF